MLRKIIRIDREKCNGCGACAAACHEGAIEMLEGKAVLTREDYCDGLGDCLPACPMDAISFEEREAPAYDEAAVRLAQLLKKGAGAPRACPGMRAAVLAPRDEEAGENVSVKVKSQLRQWPVQIKLLPVSAPWLDKADLLIAADCTAYAYANFHQDFIRGRITLVGCPKLDAVDYTEKLTAVFRSNDIQSITVVRMEVPCCGGLESAVRRAMEACGKASLPCRVVTITTAGSIRE